MVIEFKVGDVWHYAGVAPWDRAKEIAYWCGLSYRMIDETGLVVREYHP